MVRWTWILVWLCAAASAQAGAVSSFDDIQFWAGTGSKRAAVAIDWDDASSADTALVWGFRWDGDATGEDLFRAVLAADTRLFAKLQDYGGELGSALYGVGYDDGDGAFELDDGTTFDDDGLAMVSGASDGALPVDAGDFYREGWFLGFWHYGVSTGNPYAGGSWSSSNWGMSSRTLADGDWDSWTYTPTFNFQAFAQNVQAAPVPEPATLALALIAVACLGWRVRGRTVCAAVAAMLLLAGASTAEAGPFASQVVSYTPGNAVDVWTPGPYQTDGKQSLGEPTRDTEFNSQVGVFYPAFGTDELVIVGTGGELTVRFDAPIVDDPLNPFGLDLLIFGNAFYVRSQAEVATSIFAEPGKVSVSQDGQTWFDVPDVFADTAFPTLGYTDTVYSGFDNAGGTIPTDFTLPVDPSFVALGKTEAEINAGYAGSGGGTGVDLASVGLSWAQFVRVWQPAADGWSTEIDAFADVSPVPEPSTLALAALGMLGVFMTARKRRR
jgi:hypothetical protein